MLRVNVAEKRGKEGVLRYRERMAKIILSAKKSGGEILQTRRPGRNLFSRAICVPNNFRTRGTRSGSPLARNSHRLSRLCAHPLDFSLVSLSLSLSRFLVECKTRTCLVVSRIVATLREYSPCQRKMSHARNNCIDFYTYHPPNKT